MTNWQVVVLTALWVAVLVSQIALMRAERRKPPAVCTGTSHHPPLAPVGGPRYALSRPARCSICDQVVALDRDGRLTLHAYRKPKRRWVS